MSLISCPECNSEVSDMANNCPKCGHPIMNGEKNRDESITSWLKGTPSKPSLFITGILFTPLSFVWFYTAYKFKYSTIAFVILGVFGVITLFTGIKSLYFALKK